MTANKTKQYDMTILVPVYDEQENMESLEKEMSLYLEKSAIKSCVLFIDDKSKDDSLICIKKICERNKDMYFLSHAVRGGLSSALKSGIDYTQSKYVGYIDADLQTTPDDFNLLIQHIEDYELVTGIRTNRKDSLLKRMQSKAANGFRRMMTGDNIVDTGCPLKIMHTEIAKKIPFFTGLHRFLPAMVYLLNGKVKQVPVRHFPRVAGKSKYHLFNRLKGPFIDCFAYRWMKKRYIDYKIDSTDLL